MDLDARYAPDVLHLNSFSTGVSSRRRPVLLTVHSCVASWWKAVKGTPIGNEWSRYAQHVRQSLEEADLIVAPSEAMLDSLEDNYDLRVGKVCTDVIPNGSRIDLYAPRPKEEFILGAGRLWDEGKSIRTLAETAAHLAWPVLLAGESRGPDGQTARFHGCRMLGQLGPRELTDLYGRAAIFVHPAKYEPFGLSVLEAALSGCALVLGDIRSLREIWGDAAVFVSPGDSEALATAINRLIQAPQRRNELAAMSLKRAQKFTTEQMGTQYMNAYESVIRERYACAS